jgi:DNA-binding NtrC family response regulator
MTQQESLRGARVLVVEDEYFIADDLARALASCGAVTVGPVNSVEQAHEALRSDSIDAAILDLNLHGELAFPIAERLSQEGMPCLIISGYGEEALPDPLKTMARLEKPVSGKVAMASLARELAIGRGANGG